MFPCCAHIVAVMSPADEEQYEISGLGQAQNFFRDGPAHLTDDFPLGLAAAPGGRLPFPHLRDGDDRCWHGCRLVAWGTNLEPMGGGHKKQFPESSLAVLEIQPATRQTPLSPGVNAVVGGEG